MGKILRILSVDRIIQKCFNKHHWKFYEYNLCFDIYVFEMKGIISEKFKNKFVKKVLAICS